MCELIELLGCCPTPVISLYNAGYPIKVTCTNYYLSHPRGYPNPYPSAERRLPSVPCLDDGWTRYTRLDPPLRASWSPLPHTLMFRASGTQNTWKRMHCNLAHQETLLVQPEFHREYQQFVSSLDVERVSSGGYSSVPRTRGWGLSPPGVVTFDL